MRFPLIFCLMACALRQDASAMGQPLKAINQVVLFVLIKTGFSASTNSLLNDARWTRGLSQSAGHGLLTLVATCQPLT